MSIIEAIILGIVQGLTEFIPVSSSGHLIAGHELFGTSESTLLFDVALHIGTLVALLIYFYRDILNLINSVHKRNQMGRLARTIAVATLPAASIGFVASDWIDETLRKPEIVIATMLIMGSLMLIIETRISPRKKLEEVEMKEGLFVGFAQALALVPGVSRSGATITAGLLQGFNRSAAAKLSFLMAIPITAGAILGTILGAETGEFSGVGTPFVVGVVASLLSGLFAIRFLMSYLNKHSLAAFAYYRFAFAAVLLLIVLV